MNKLFLALGISLLFSSCAPRLTPFTDGMKTKYGWTESQMKRIQFYTSETITLRREFVEGATEIAGGEIKIVDGRKIEQIVIPARTPGVLLQMPQTDRMAIAFETGNNERFLMFGPNPKLSGQYVLLGRDWNSGRGTVTYDAKEWYTETGDGLARLMVKLSLVRKQEAESRTVKGRRL